VNGSEEGGSPFVVSGCDSPELFKFGAEILNQVPDFVHLCIVLTLLFSVGFRWDDGFDPGLFQ
jgi:hypothetical protein